VISNVAQAIVSRVGARATLTAGLLISALSVALLVRLPVDGHYFWDLFPAFVLGGAGMGLSFVPVTIAGLTGVERADAGVASGLINTTQQIGGAIGVAAATTIAATYTSRYVTDHPGVSPANGAALTHGFEIAFYVLAAIAALAAVASAILVESKPPSPKEAQAVDADEVVLEAAA
jgi:MFS family permease